jgi:REP element-mobilizing transposase RayT
MISNGVNTLQHVNKRCNWICHAYCLMDNHYHLLIETPEGNLSAGMRQLNGVYTQLFNKLHGRVYLRVRSLLLTLAIFYDTLVPLWPVRSV